MRALERLVAVVEQGSLTGAAWALAPRAALITHILGLLRDAGHAADPLPAGGPGIAPAEARLIEPLSRAEIRVLRYPPTSLSVSTVRTHMRHLYTKLSVHRRHEAVDRARVLGLLAPATP